MFHECRNNRAGTCRFVAGCGRVTNENFLTARSLRGTCGIVRSFNPDLSDVGIEKKSRNRSRRVHGSLKRPVQFAAGHVIRREERHADGVQSRLDRDRGESTRPLPVVFAISLSQSKSFTRSPSTVTSSCSPLTPPKDRLEVAGDSFNLE